MRDLRKIFIRNLKYFRSKKGMRQLDLSLEINKGANYINSIENSKYFPSPETIQEIADVLGIKPMQLFDENGCLDSFVFRKDYESNKNNPLELLDKEKLVVSSNDCHPVSNDCRLGRFIFK